MTDHTVLHWRDAERDPADPLGVLRLIAEHTAASVRISPLDGRPALREELATASGHTVTYSVSVPGEPHEWLVFSLGDADRDEVARFDAHMASLRWVGNQLFDRNASASASRRRASASRSSG